MELLLGFVVFAAFSILPPAAVIWALCLPVPYDGERTALWAGALGLAAELGAALHLDERGKGPDASGTLKGLRSGSFWGFLGSSGALLLMFMTQGLWWRVLVLSPWPQELRLLQEVRDKAQAYRAAHGGWPSKLEQVGPLPAIEVWAVERGGGLAVHRHRPSNAVQVVSSSAPVRADFFHPGTYGEPIYRDGREVGGRVVGATSVTLAADFNGFDPASDPLVREDGVWRLTKIVSPGLHDFGFVLDGKERSARINDDFTAPALAPYFEAQPADLEDAGGWGYNPATGRVFIACTAVAPKLGKPVDAY